MDKRVVRLGIEQTTKKNERKIGTEAIEAFIKKNHIEALYRYSNIKSYALKLQSDKQRKALGKPKGVLSVQDDQVMQLQ